MLSVRTRTIYTYMNRWCDKGISGLFILGGRGRKPWKGISTKKIIKSLEEKVSENARSLRKMATLLCDELGLKVSRDMVRRLLKSMGYTWKRFRKSLKGKQDEEEYEKKLSELKQLLELYRSGYLNLYFADESGFNLEGYIPYGWQPKNKHIEITPVKTKKTQVFGLMSLDNELHAYTSQSTINSDLLIAFIDDFHGKIKSPTAIVIDNAPIHHSKSFESKIKQWKEDDLYVFFLPKYSPHLNPIEILWRMMKYKWLPYEDIESQEELDCFINEILNSFGKEFSIDFKESRLKVSNIFL